MPAGLKTASASPESTCASCKKSQKDLGAALKACGGCLTALYCSKMCQEATRKAHGPECQEIRTSGGRVKVEDVKPTLAFRTSSFTANPVKKPPTTSTPIPKLGPAHPTMPMGGQSRSLMDMLDTAGISVSNPNGHGRATMIFAQGNPGSAVSLANLSRSASSNAYLSAFTEREAMRQLVDCFRLRCEDEYKFNGNTVGLYNDEDPIDELNRFLTLAEENKVVPKWWGPARRADTQRLAQDESGKCSIQKILEKAHVITGYGGDAQMPMKLRGLAERVYGTPVIR